MASTNSDASRPWRPLITLLLVITVGAGILFTGVRSSDDASWTPKLALDLEGGTQIILQAVTANDEPVSAQDINQAISIIRQRVDSSGVAEAEITSQGGRNIVVALPGSPSEETLALVRESAQMQFRPVLYFGDPGPIVLDDAAVDGEAEVTEGDDSESTESNSADGAQTPDSDDAELVVEGPLDALVADDESAAQPANPSDLVQITQEVVDEFYALDCTSPESLIGGGGVADPDGVLVTCSEDGSTKYILGPMEISGNNIATATSGLKTTQTGATTNEWIVNISFNSAGTKEFETVSSRLAELPEYEQWIYDPTSSAPNMFAMALDNLVISAPSVTQPFYDGQASIEGTFTNESANKLANQLSFGALPLTFEVQSEETISATLGSEQLQKGILAGLIGLALVAVYSLVQYRVLGLITISSLVVAAVLTYLSLAILSWVQGYRLSLAGVAGIIVAIGITADSFIVLFERIRDELREGRTLSGAIDVGWDRAKRTILASDAINFIAAIVLYFLAVGGVRGFAFTLGLTTLIDLIVVFFFTHPLLKVLSKLPFFRDGHKLSGFSPESLGVDRVRYVGRGRVSQPDHGSWLNEDGTRMTIAQRKAARERQQHEELGGSAQTTHIKDGE